MGEQMTVVMKPDGTPIEILVAEDSPTQAAKLQYVLERNGYRVTVARDGRQAMDHVNGFHPAIVITDIVMPGLNGYEVCQRIKADSGTRDIPVILLTSLAKSDDVLEALVCGADGFITKPYSAEYFLSFVEKVLANASLSIIQEARVQIKIQQGDKTRLLDVDPQKMLGVLLSTYEAASRQNAELVQTQEELSLLTDQLEDLVEQRTEALSIEVAEHERAEAQLVIKTTELEYSNRELRDFAYVASHDLQEPLRMVISYMELLTEKYSNKLDEKADKYIHYAVDGAYRMQRLITDLLAYSRVSTRAQPPVVTDCAEVVREVIQNLGRAIADNEAEVTVSALPKVLADRTQLGQVFQNLISNAIKFKGDARPKVEVTVRQNGANWEFCVADNGIGIDPQFYERIFVIFQRLHEQGKYPGSGIGLSIVKKIVERHGGRIWIESALGEGSRFWFTMPVLANQMEVSA